MSPNFSKNGLDKKRSTTDAGLSKKGNSKASLLKSGASKEGFSQNGLPNNDDSKKDLVLSLTLREKEIIKLLTDGYTNKEMAKKLKISVRTVETHRKNIMNKLHLKNLAGLIKFSIVNKIVILE